MKNLKIIEERIEKIVNIQQIILEHPEELECWERGILGEWELSFGMDGLSISICSSANKELMEDRKERLINAIKNELLKGLEDQTMRTAIEDNLKEFEELLDSICPDGKSLNEISVGKREEYNRVNFAKTALLKLLGED